jgi:hypothetical protein
VTLSEIVIWMAERARQQQRGRTMRRAGVSQQQLNHLVELGIISRNGDRYFLLKHAEYRRSRRMAA